MDCALPVAGRLPPSPNRHRPKQLGWRGRTHVSDDALPPCRPSDTHHPFIHPDLAQPPAARTRNRCTTMAHTVRKRMLTAPIDTPAMIDSMISISGRPIAPAMPQPAASYRPSTLTMAGRRWQEVETPRRNAVAKRPMPLRGPGVAPTCRSTTKRSCTEARLRRRPCYRP